MTKLKVGDMVKVVNYYGMNDEVVERIRKIKTLQIVSIDGWDRANCLQDNGMIRGLYLNRLALVPSRQRKCFSEN